jgi:hypothetical protein
MSHVTLLTWFFSKGGDIASPWFEFEPGQPSHNAQARPSIK